MGKTADAIVEGVSIASAAARLAVRNHILVETIAHDEPYTVDRFAGLAHETLIGLADEQDAAADLARRQRKNAWGKFTDPDSTHDYRDRDTRNLRKRQRQYRGVAKELRRRAEDSEEVQLLVKESRDAAWGDVEANLLRRLAVEGMRAGVDPDYDMLRAARMQSLRLIDLSRLAAHRRHLGDGEDGEPDPSSNDEPDFVTGPGPAGQPVDVSDAVE
ncbi:asparagine synthase [Microbacterium deminutum]|uniref:Asparagine synthase n=1 Tax=Microbacterium deminutum TaxID=344164 RepID=A0ABN2QYN5_9MICO